MSEVASFLGKACVFWLVLSSLWFYPHSLSYFNETVGGHGGSNIILGSGVDWCQDARYVEWWGLQNTPSTDRKLVRLSWLSGSPIVESLNKTAVEIDSDDAYGCVVSVVALRELKDGVNGFRDLNRLSSSGFLLRLRSDSANTSCITYSQVLVSGDALK